MPTLNSLDNIGGAAAVGGWAEFVNTSKNITIARAGKVVIAVVPPGGAGARGAAADPRGCRTGGNSAPWGRKVLSVSASDVLDFVVGAPGAFPATESTNGGNGGTSTVALNGSNIITAQGGEGGRYHATAAVAATPVATITGCDFWVPGIQAGNATSSAVAGAASGGAAVDVLRCGLGRSPNNTNVTAVLGGSVGTDLGGGKAQAWIVLADFGFGLGDGRTGGHAGVGANVNLVLAGALAGGGAPEGNFGASGGGYGGGGGGGSTGAGTGSQRGDGGPGYFYVVFYPED